MSEKAQEEDRFRAAGERYMRKPKNLAKPGGGVVAAENKIVTFWPAS